MCSGSKKTSNVDTILQYIHSTVVACTRALILVCRHDFSESEFALLCAESRVHVESSHNRYVTCDWLFSDYCDVLAERFSDFGVLVTLWVKGKNKTAVQCSAE